MPLQGEHEPSPREPGAEQVRTSEETDDHAFTVQDDASGRDDLARHVGLESA